MTVMVPFASCHPLSFFIPWSLAQDLRVGQALGYFHPLKPSCTSSRTLFKCHLLQEAFYHFHLEVAIPSLSSWNPLQFHILLVARISSLNPRSIFPPIPGVGLGPRQADHKH